MIGLSLAISACSPDRNLRFDCEYVGETKYKSNLSSTLFKEDGKTILATQIFPDGSSGQTMELNLSRSNSMIYIKDLLYIDSSIQESSKWSYGELSCAKRDSGNNTEIEFSCRSSSSATANIFTFDASKGVTSIAVDCKDCDTNARERLVEGAGLGRPCQG
jgi:hypothetical protein